MFRCNLASSVSKLPRRIREDSSKLRSVSEPYKSFAAGDIIDPSPEYCIEL